MKEENMKPTTIPNTPGLWEEITPQQALDGLREKHIAGGMKKSGHFFNYRNISTIYWKPQMDDVVTLTEDNFNEIMIKEGILPFPEELCIEFDDPEQANSLGAGFYRQVG